MSERIELTRGAPNKDSSLEYSGADPEAAIAVLHDTRAGVWFGLVKIWTDAPDLLDRFVVLVHEQHPDGEHAITRVVHERYAAWRSRKLADQS